MPTTATLRRQHDEMARLIDRCMLAIDGYRSRGDAYPILVELNRLAGRVRHHFAAEDEGLFPALIDGPESELSARAAALWDQYGALAHAFEDFLRIWPSSAVIAGNFLTFKVEATLILHAIAERTVREEELLFRLIESGVLNRAA